MAVFLLVTKSYWRFSNKLVSPSFQHTFMQAQSSFMGCVKFFLESETRKGFTFSKQVVQQLFYTV